MIDYRVENKPVKTSNESFDYGLQKKGKALISIPSRAENDVEVKNFQPVKTLKLNERIPDEKG